MFGKQHRNTFNRPKASSLKPRSISTLKIGQDALFLDIIKAFLQFSLNITRHQSTGTMPGESTAKVRQSGRLEMRNQDGRRIQVPSRRRSAAVVASVVILGTAAACATAAVISSRRPAAADARVGRVRTVAHHKGHDQGLDINCPPKPWELAPQFNLSEFTRASWFIQELQETRYLRDEQFHCMAITYDQTDRWIPGSSGRAYKGYHYANDGETNGPPIFYGASWPKKMVREGKPLPAPGSNDTFTCLRGSGSDDPALLMARCFIPDFLSIPWSVVAVGTFGETVPRCGFEDPADVDLLEDEGEGPGWTESMPEDTSIDEEDDTLSRTGDGAPMVKVRTDQLTSEGGVKLVNREVMLKEVGRTERDSAQEDGNEARDAFERRTGGSGGSFIGRRQRRLSEFHKADWIAQGDAARDAAASFNDAVDNFEGTEKREERQQQQPPDYENKAGQDSLLRGESVRQKLMPRMELGTNVLKKDWRQDPRCNYTLPGFEQQLSERLREYDWAIVINGIPDIISKTGDGCLLDEPSWLNVGESGGRNLLLLSREPVMSVETRGAMYAALRRQHISTAKLRRVEHRGCLYEGAFLKGRRPLVQLNATKGNLLRDEESPNHPQPDLPSWFQVPGRSKDGTLTEVPDLRSRELDDDDS